MVIKKPAMREATVLKIANEEKKARFQTVMDKISSDWDEVKGYNKSFNCPPPSTWAVFLGDNVFFLILQAIASFKKLRFCMVVIFCWAVDGFDRHLYDVDIEIDDDNDDDDDTDDGH